MIKANLVSEKAYMDLPQGCGLVYLMVILRLHLMRLVGSLAGRGKT